MIHRGRIKDLIHQNEHPIRYTLQLENERIEINPYIGQKVKIKFLNEINCIHCDRKIKKSYNNGYCYPCFQSLPQNDICMVRPNLCHYDNGTCRDKEFAESFCMMPHYVYLALSSDIKVGLTRKTNAFKRWIDQGAVKSIPIAELPTRKMAGLLEEYLAKHLPDKTNWRKMLKGEIEDKCLADVREHVLTIIPDEYKEYLLNIEQINEFIYPVNESVSNINTITLDKQNEVEGILIGIKGQYLLLDTGVFNTKKHLGYNIEFALKDSN